MTYLKKIFKSIAYTFLVLLVSLCIYTFVVTDIMKKDYVNVFGYTYFVVKTGSMSGTLEVDDIIIVKLSKDANLNDIITYVNDDGEIITHRLVRKVSGKLIAQGDVNNAEDNPITNDQLVGVVKLAISPSFILKLVATFLILFIFLALINFDNIIQKYEVCTKVTEWIKAYIQDQKSKGSYSEGKFQSFLITTLRDYMNDDSDLLKARQEIMEVIAGKLGITLEKLKSGEWN